MPVKPVTSQQPTPDTATGTPRRRRPMKVLLFANTDWYHYNFNLPLARVLQRQGVHVILLSPPGRFAERLVDAGFHWVALPMNRLSLNPWEEFRLLRYIIELYRRERPDLVHHFTIKCVVYGSIAARITGVDRRVNAVTGLGHVFTSDSLRNQVLRPVVRRLLQLALTGRLSRLIVQNPDDYSAFADEQLLVPEKIRLIRGLGVNIERFHPHQVDESIEETPPRPQPLRVLLATRLLWEKGIREYVQAARLLKKSGHDVEFLLAGDPDPGNPASIRPEQIDDWRREGVINFLGYVEDMPTLFSQVDVAVLPSYREGLPQCMLEAAACGLPLVATDVPGCREIVEPGINGLLIPPRNSAALAEAIAHLDRNRAQCRVLGEASRRKVLQDFDEKTILRMTLNVYREILHS